MRASVSCGWLLVLTLCILSKVGREGVIVIQWAGKSRKVDIQRIHANERFRHACAPFVEKDTSNCDDRARDT